MRYRDVEGAGDGVRDAERAGEGEKGVKREGERHTYVNIYNEFES